MVSHLGSLVGCSKQGVIGHGTSKYLAFLHGRANIFAGDAQLHLVIQCHIGTYFQKVPHGGPQGTSLCALKKAPGLYLEVLHVAPSEQVPVWHCITICSFAPPANMFVVPCRNAKYLLVPCPVTPCLEQPTSEPKWHTSPS